MAKTKESTADRRAREAAEVHADRQRWEAEKPMRLLRALARATDLGINAEVCTRHGNVLSYSFGFDYNCERGDVETLQEWEMCCIEQNIDAMAASMAKAQRLREVRKELLSTLSDEQKEALGLI